MNEMLERDYSEGNEGDGVNGQFDGSPYQRRPRNLFFFFFFFFFYIWGCVFVSHQVCLVLSCDFEEEGVVM